MLLPAAGGLLGGAAAGSLGRFLSPLDYPRQALTNLGLSPFLGRGAGAPDEEGNATERESGLNSLMPGAAGLLAGGAALATPLAPFAPLIGAGVAGGAQGLGHLFDSATGGDSFEAPSTSELLGKLGGDPDSTVQNLALGVATDPLTYAGLGGGWGAGKALEGGVQGLREARAGAAGLGEWTANEAALAQRTAALKDLTAGAAKLKDAHLYGPPTMEPWAEELKAAASAPGNAEMRYRPDVVGALPSMEDLARGGSRGFKTYKNVDPKLGADLLDMGAATPGEGGSLQMLSHKAPDFSQVRGSWLKPSGPRADMLAGGDPLAMPQTIGPPIDGPLSTLDAPAQQYQGMLQQGTEGLTGPLNGSMDYDVPTLAKLLGEGEASRMQTLLPEGMVRHPHFQSNAMSLHGNPEGLTGHLVDLPIDEATQQLGALYGQSSKALHALRGARPSMGTLTPLQALLARLGV